jgi:hypothetical protein
VIELKSGIIIRDTRTGGYEDEPEED